MLCNAICKNYYCAVPACAGNTSMLALHEPMWLAASYKQGATDYVSVSASKALHAYISATETCLAVDFIPLYL